MVNPLSLDSFWFNKRKFEEAERIFYEAKYGGVSVLFLTSILGDLYGD